MIQSLLFFILLKGKSLWLIWFLAVLLLVNRWFVNLWTPPSRLRLGNGRQPPVGEKWVTYEKEKEQHLRRKRLRNRLLSLAYLFCFAKRVEQNWQKTN
jgi:hypothetical protein